MARMQTRFRGKAWTFGEQVDTDMIVPGKYLTRLDPKSLGEIVMSGAREDFAPNVERGDFIIAGPNFGCGSSREHAPLGILGAGVPVVIADSFARIFYRNAINVGLPVLEAPGIRAATEDSDELIVDIAAGTIENLRTGRVTMAAPLPDNMLEIIEVGGLINVVRKRLGHAPQKEEEDPDAIEL